MSRLRRPLAPIILAALVIAAIVGLGLLVQHPRPTRVGSVAGLTSTSSGIHLAMTFNWSESPTSGCMTQEGNVDYVWGAQTNSRPFHNYPDCTGHAWHELYIPWGRDGGNDQLHTTSWYVTNHRDWIEYKCDKTTVATSFNQSSMPYLDITNPSVQTYLEQNWLTPALTTGFQGISIDNDPALINNGQECGHYSTSGSWVAQYSGVAYGDGSYVSAQSKALSAIVSWVHASYPSATVTGNTAEVDAHGATSQWQSATAPLDLVFDECGLTSGCHSTRNYLVNTSWVNEITQYVARGKAGQALALDVLEPYTIGPNVTTNGNASISAAAAHFDLLWALGNYLLVRYTHTYLWWGSKYGNPPYSQAEYGQLANIGTATDDEYANQSVYRRDFTGGVVFVNPSSSTSYTITIPSGMHWPSSTSAPSSYTMPIHSAIILLGSSPSPSPAPTATSTVTPRPAASATPVPTGQPTSIPTIQPTSQPTSVPTASPSPEPTACATFAAGKHLGKVCLSS